MTAAALSYHEAVESEQAYVEATIREALTPDGVSMRRRVPVVASSNGKEYEVDRDALWVLSEAWGAVRPSHPIEQALLALLMTPSAAPLLKLMADWHIQNNALDVAELRIAGARDV